MCLPFTFQERFRLHACVFVDGENLRHALCDLFLGEFTQEDYLPKQAEWTRFFDWLAGEASLLFKMRIDRLRTYWYVIEHLDFYPYKFPKNDPKALLRLLSKQYDFADLAGIQLKEEMDQKVEELQKKMRVMSERFRGWTIIQNGIELRHRAIEFRRAGACRYDLFKGEMSPEKAVDVKLATDLLELRNIYDVAIILSGDQDYVPAVKIIKDSGKRVVNVTFLTRHNLTLPGGAWRLNTTCDDRIEIRHDQLADLMKIYRADTSTK